MMSELMLDIKALNLVINKNPLLCDFNLTIGLTERIGITGPSGCGKSTLMKSILKGQFPEGSKTDRFLFNCEKSAYIPQGNGLLPWFSLKENLAIYSVNSSEIVSYFNLKNSLENFPHQLSGGEYQRATLAIAMISDPDFYFADEPLTELDLTNKWKLLSFWSSKIKEKRASLLLVSHDVETLLYLCDRVFILSDKPGHVVNEIILKNTHPRDKEYLISQDFIKAKAQMLSAMREDK